jgi:rubrerythrin
MNEKLSEILDFAIEREYEAAKFYKELQASVKEQASKEILKEFEIMELGHAKMLEGFKSRGETGVEKFNPKKVQDLKLADYMVEPQASKETNYQEAIVIAMKREEAARDLYAKMAEQAEDPAVKGLFTRLADEEANHKHRLELVYDDEILYEN